jgi:hypothetical protein
MVLQWNEMKPTDINDIRKRAEEYKLIANYGDSISWFWEQAGADPETLQRAKDLFAHIRRAQLPEETIGICKAGEEILNQTDQLIEQTEDNHVLNRMMRQFREVLE